MPKTALITGITGQDGSYLAEFLLARGYRVAGLLRRTSVEAAGTARITHLLNDLALFHGDLDDPPSLRRILDVVVPDEIYNLGAMSHVRHSFDMPLYTAHATGLSSLAVLEALRQSGGHARFYQASSSELFGSSPPPQSETTPFHPRSPYGCAKAFAYHTTVNYREAYGMHASNGILFNHESPRRGEEFVTRKVTRAVARIKLGRQQTVELGNLGARRDWGFAGDFVEAMWLILQQPHPEDFVIATGEAHTVQKFVERAFDSAGLSWREHVVINSSLFRPAEVDVLLGDASKALRVLGWKPRVTFDELISRMVEADIREELNK